MEHRQGKGKITVVYGGIIGTLWDWDPWLMRPGRRITGESGLIDTAKLQVLGQIEMAKPRSDDMMTNLIVHCQRP